MTDEELELAALCGLAWERRDTPELRPSVDAIVDWWDRRYLRRWQERQAELARLKPLLREPELDLDEPFGLEGAAA